MLKIEQALSSPVIYAFGELLDVPTVKEAGVPFQQLQIFAYGTVREYQKSGGSSKMRCSVCCFFFPLCVVLCSGPQGDGQGKEILFGRNSGCATFLFFCCFFFFPFFSPPILIRFSKGLPALGKAELRKLQQLTLASLAAKHSQLSYTLLKQELDVQELRELEDLVLDTVYQGIVDAKIDQMGQRVIVDFAIGRDVRDSDIKHMQDVLNVWLNRSASIMKVIEDKVSLARSEIKVEQMRKEEFDQRVKDVKENIKAMIEAQEAEQRAGMRRQMGGPGGGGGMGGMMNMMMGGLGGQGGQRRDPRGDPRDPRNQGKGKGFGF